MGLFAPLGVGRVRICYDHAQAVTNLKKCGKGRLGMQNWNILQMIIDRMDNQDRQSIDIDFKTYIIPNPNK